MKRFTLGFVFLFTAALLVGAISAQEQPQEPLIYDGLEFPELPYASRWIEVNGARMHYLEGGDPAGAPILFLHGNPTWSYLWRDIMPHLEDQGRVIAVDLVGFGRSDKPDIGYRFVDHREYLDGFITEMGLENITLVIHDWGSGLGFDYASRNPDNVKAIAFMESMLPPVPFAEIATLPAPFPDVFIPLRTEGIGEELVLNQNFFVEGILVSDAQITDEAVLNAYRAPFPTPETRLPTLVWPREVPFGDEPADVAAIMRDYGDWVAETDTPMLLLYVTPGALTPEAGVQWAQNNITNLETVFLGEGGHFIQELYPDAIGEAIANWLERGDLID